MWDEGRGAAGKESVRSMRNGSSSHNDGGQRVGMAEGGKCGKVRGEAAAVRPAPRAVTSATT